MKTFLIRALRALLAFVAIFAVRPAAATPDPPDVAAVLSSMRQASGGERWAKVRTLHLTAQVQEGDGTPYIRSRWEDVGTGRYLINDLTSVGHRAEGFDGISAWRLARSGIAYALGDTDSSMVAADEAFRISRGWWFRDRHPATVALVGRRSEDGRSFDVLTVTPEGGRSFAAWIDQATHLLARTDEQRAEDRVVTTYGDYRAVDGLMIPFQIRSGDGENPQWDAVETVRSVEINEVVPDTLYALPARPTSDVTLPPGRDSVEVPFRLTPNNQILVKVSVNGHAPVDAEFDSGGSLLLQPKMVRTLGLTSSGGLRAGGGGEGSTTAGVGVIDSLAIGAARVHHLVFHGLVFDSNHPDVALIGLEILQRFVVRFDFDKMRMTLSRPGSLLNPNHGLVIPFHFQDNQPEVKGAIDGIAGLFAIDTGDSGSLLLIAPFARRYGLVDRYHADIPYDGRSIGVTHGVWARRRVHTTTLDGADGRPAVVVHDPVTRISLQTGGFDANRNVSGNIGLGILKQFNLTFDYPEQRLILEKNHFYGRHDVFNRAGLRLKREGMIWTISIVYPDSPADAAALKPGDKIESIDGLRANQLDEDELATRLKGPIGSRMRLIVAAPQHRTVVLVLRDLF